MKELGSLSIRSPRGACMRDEMTPSWVCVGMTKMPVQIKIGISANNKGVFITNHECQRVFGNVTQNVNLLK